MPLPLFVADRSNPGELHVGGNARADLLSHWREIPSSFSSIFCNIMSNLAIHFFTLCLIYNFQPIGEIPRSARLNSSLIFATSISLLPAPPFFLNWLSDV